MELHAERMIAGGDALAHAPDGRVAMIEGALPGERVEVEITADRSDLLRGRVTDVLDAADDRLVPPCPFARVGCGGCTWQHIAPQAQVRYKQDIVRDALRRIARLDDAPVAPTVTLPTEAYRTTVRAMVHDGRAAFRRHHSHDPIDVDHCLVAHPLVDEVLRDGRFPDAREVTVRSAPTTGERCVFVAPPNTSITVPDDVRHGHGAHVHETIHDHTFRVSARSFFQSRTDGAAALVKLVRDAVGQAEVVADLYCGVGLFAGTIEQPTKLYAVERDRNAVRDAKVNLRARRASVIDADVGAWRGADVDVVIADPSRAGLGRDGARTISRCDPSKVVLVSCDPAALARDVALLRDDSYELKSVTPVDLFPHTPHVECVSILELV